MIFFQMLNEDVVDTGWMPFWGVITSANDFKTRKYLVNKKVYIEYNAEFREAYQADLMWDQLLYREPKVKG